MPVFDASRTVIGTFALYYHEPRRPTPEELHLIEDFAHLAAVVIEGHGFLRAMVRNLVGTAVTAGLGLGVPDAEVQRMVREALDGARGRNFIGAA
mgnify:CR=1 FL=1